MTYRLLAETVASTVAECVYAVVLLGLLFRSVFLPKAEAVSFTHRSCLLQMGTYTVTVNASGFKKSGPTGVAIQATQFEGGVILIENGWLLNR